MLVKFSILSITEQHVDCIVNAWNRNFIPYWLLLPQGVSKAIKKEAGLKPFNEVMRYGILDLGEAVLTSAGKLPYKGIIHVAGLHAYWVASEKSIRLSVNNAIKLAIKNNFASIAIPLIGSGTGAKKRDWVKQIILEEAEKYQDKIQIVLCDYQPK